MDFAQLGNLAKWEVFFIMVRMVKGLHLDKFLYFLFSKSNPSTKGENSCIFSIIELFNLLYITMRTNQIYIL